VRSSAKAVGRNIRSLFSLGGVSNRVIGATVAVFLCTSTILPSFAALNTGVNPYASLQKDSEIGVGDSEWFIPYRDDDVLQLLSDSDVLVTAEDGILQNPTVTDDTGVVFEEDPVTLYEVQEGDTLEYIAQTNGVTTETIKFNNGLTSDTLKVGQKLNVLPVDGVLLEVKEDQSISTLAEELEIDVQILADKNDVTTKAQLKKGEKIVVPGEDQLAKAKERAEAEAKALAEARRQAQIAASRVSNSYVTTNNSAINTSKFHNVVVSNGSYVWPAGDRAGTRVTQWYRYGHPGLDIAYVRGDHTTSILAMAPGTVIESKTGWNGGYGNMVLVSHGNGLVTRYAHLREIYVTVGQRVNGGDAVGWMGKTGRVYGRTGLHLHFEVILNGRKVNPSAYVK